MLLQEVIGMKKRAGRTDECPDERLQTVCSSSWKGPTERGRGARCGTEGGEHGHGLCVVVEVVEGKRKKQMSGGFRFSELLDGLAARRPASASARLQ